MNDYANEYGQHTDEPATCIMALYQAACYDCGWTSAIADTLALASQLEAEHVHAKAAV